MNVLPVVLFLSTNNASRSQMAEALLRKYSGNRFEIVSAGLDAGEFHPFTKQALDEMGVSYAGQVAKEVKPLLGKLNVKYLVTVSAPAGEAAPTVFPGAIYYFNWQLPDPEVGGGSDTDRLNRYRDVAKQVDEKVQAWLQEIDTMAQGKRKTTEMQQS